MKTFAPPIRLKGLTHFDMFTVVHKLPVSSEGGANGLSSCRHIIYSV